MEITTLYTVAISGIFMLLICLANQPRITIFFNNALVLITQHLVYPPVVHRHRYIALWSRADLLIQLAYLGISTLCLIYKCGDIPSIRMRAGRIAIITIIPTFASPYLSVAADICGVPLEIL